MGRVQSVSEGLQGRKSSAFHQLLIAFSQECHQVFTCHLAVWFDVIIQLSHQPQRQCRASRPATAEGFLPCAKALKGLFRLRSPPCGNQIPVNRFKAFSNWLFFPIFSSILLSALPPRLACELGYHLAAVDLTKLKQNSGAKWIQFPKLGTSSLASHCHSFPPYAWISHPGQPAGLLHYITRVPARFVIALCPAVRNLWVFQQLNVPFFLLQPKPIHFHFSSWLQLYHIPLLPAIALVPLSGASCQWALLLDNILSTAVCPPVAALQPGRKGLDEAGGNLNKGLWIICLWYLCTASAKRPGSWQPYNNSNFTFLRKKLRFRLDCFLQRLSAALK